METIKRTKIVDVLKSDAFGTTVNVKGWVRTRRGSKQVNFIAMTVLQSIMFRSLWM